MLNLAPPIPPKVSFQGFGMYEGPAPKVAGGNFNCLPTKCYAIGKDVEEVFKSLQKNVNRFAATVGMRKLVVDGLIGHQTVVTTATVLTYLKQFTGGNDVAEIAVATSPTMQTVSQYALELRNLIRANAEARDVPFVAPRTPTPIEKEEEEQAKKEIKQRGDETANYRWAWWVAGAAVLAGAVVVGVSYSRKGRKRRRRR